jgi:hypothetical protein
LAGEGDPYAFVERTVLVIHFLGRNTVLVLLDHVVLEVLHELVDRHPEELLLAPSCLGSNASTSKTVRGFICGFKSA